MKIIDLQQGKLYETRKWFWLVYPSKEIAALALARRVASVATVGAHGAYYWSRDLQSTVSYVEPGSVFMALSVSDEFVEVLFAETLGWIWVPGWAKKNIRREKAT